MDSLISKLVNTLTGDKVAQQGKDYWVDDAKCRACYECETPFSVFVRRHHCRICGRIFCSSCTFNSIPATQDAAAPANGEQAWLRVCNYCHRMRQRDDDGSERAQPDSAGQLLLGATHAASSSRLGFDEPGAVTSSSGSVRTGNSSPSGKLQQALSQRSSSSGGSDGSLTWDVPPVLERTFGPTAEAAADEAATPALDSESAAAPAAQPVSGEGGAAGATSSSSGSSSRPLSPSSQPLSSTSGLHPVVLLNRQGFARAADEHLQQLLWQLLQAEDVQQPDMWLPIVLRLVCEASRALLPAAAAAFGEQDPRFYVKVKRLPDMGTPADCRVVRGVVAKKNVAHRRMRTDIPQPAVVLLSGALEYQRVANKLSSFDTLLEQEREHLRLAVARIAACKPDLLLVERSVARSAQEELLQRGIALVQHTKPDLLERLGRCMGVKVAASLEELSPQLVGSCSRFKVEQLPSAPVPMPQQPAAANGSAAEEASQQLAASPAAGQAQSGGSFSVNSLTAAIALGDAGSAAPAVVTAAAAAAGAKPAPVSATPAPAKTLMLFDGCPLPLGCTVLLWGASAAELTKLKRIVRFGVLAAYHQGLECSFLAEELALATAALATPDMSRDAALYHSLARAAISSSREATNPCGLPSERRLLLSLSPHVVVPDALEKEQQHQHALLAHFEEVARHQQQHALAAELPDVPEQQQQQPQPSDPPPASTPEADAAGTSTSLPPHDDVQQQQQQEAEVGSAVAEPEFTDPLRRRTLTGEGALLSDEEEQQQHAVVPAEDVAELEPARAQPLWCRACSCTTGSTSTCRWRAATRGVG
ncbi:hypothetical protein COO60DRAFT_884435 [Scenedesmus sp. NREL 46B-D3]|nr:hypothetical protein COO60DRAFT_884435 [Scenedesmus sp. NREL 46B-D3]